MCQLARNGHNEEHPLEPIIRSKKRVADHGEVFTPEGMVKAMLDLVKEETERIDSRFLEPASGSGNFLVEVLRRKLDAVERKYGKSRFERRHYALLALMCIYGIELLPDNIAMCRANLLEIFAEKLKLDETDELYQAASYVLSQNLVHGNAMAMLACDNENTTECNDKKPIIFAEWAPVGRVKFQRRDFRFDSLTQSSAFGTEDLYFAERNKHPSLMPTDTVYEPMKVRDLAALAQEATR